jgi:chromosome segregation ATPase
MSWSSDRKRVQSEIDSIIGVGFQVCEALAGRHSSIPPDMTITKAKAEIATLKQANRRVSDQLQQSQKELADLREWTGNKGKDYAKVRRDLDAANANVRTAAHQVELAIKQGEDAELRRQHVQGQLNEAMRSLQSEVDARKSLEAQLDATDRSFRSQLNESKAIEAQLTEENRSLHGHLNDVTSQLQAATAREQSARYEMAAVQQKLDLAHAEITRLRTEFLADRKKAQRLESIVKGQMEAVREQAEWRINRLKEIHQREIEALAPLDTTTSIIGVE